LVCLDKLKSQNRNDDGNWLSHGDPIVFRHRITPILAFAYSISIQFFV